MTVRKLVILVGVLLLHGGVAGCVSAADEAALPDRPATAAQAAPTKKVTAEGTVEPAEMADVYAQVAGRIVKLGADPRAKDKTIDYGATVEAGTVLAQIDSELFAVRVERERAVCMRAEAEVTQAKIGEERAKAQWEDFQERKKNGTASDLEFDAAKFNYKASVAAVAVAEATLLEKKAILKLAEIELSRTTIKSPIKGVIISRRVNVGQFVDPTKTSSCSLFLIANLDKPKVWASVNEADITKVRKGQSVRITVDGRPGKVFEGKVEQVRLDATMNQNVVTYTVVVAISGTTDKLLPYLTAHLEFE
jgi:HlyD family secretion protein